MIDKARQLINACDALLIGAGAGLSAAAGLDYSETAFAKLFPEWVQRYGMTDLYTSGFYPFKTEEERWAYWAKHIFHIRYVPEALPLYRQLRGLVGQKPHFVITTNVDKQFRKAGFADEQLFEIQGDYGLMQCSRACHKRLYSNMGVVNEMVPLIHDCRVPSELVPRCPVCGGTMDINIRKDNYFVEDEHWHEAGKRYIEFVQDFSKRKNVVLLELGVGFNTPTIIRFPFDRLSKTFPNVNLIRINEAAADDNTDCLYISGHLQEIIPQLCKIE